MAYRTTPKEQQTNSRNSYRISGADDYRDKEYLRGNVKKNTGTVKGKKKTSGHGGTRHGRRSNDIIGPLLGILSGSSVVAFILMLVWIVQTAGNNKYIAYANTDNAVTKPSFIKDTKEQYVKIDAQSFCAYVGQQFTLSISAYPSYLADSVIWTSNNDEVITVDSHGNIVAVGEGIAAITANAGEYSDAIAVEVVVDAYSQSTMGLPFYSYIDYVSGEKPTSVSPSNEGFDRNTEGQKQPESEQNVEIVKPTDSVNDEMQKPSDSSNGEGMKEPQNNGQNQETQQTQGNEQNKQTQHPTDKPQDTDKQEETSEQYREPVTETAPAIDTAEMFAVLTDAGFSQYLSNACLYQSDNDYHGEVIVDSDSVHIYIKKRSETFDKAIRTALAYLLPETYENVWNSYIMSITDCTITSGGRRVRFVMPAAEAHAQIIVYNP